MQKITDLIQQYGWSVVVLCGAALVGFIVALVILFVLRRRTRKPPLEAVDFLFQPSYWRGPLRLLLPALFVHLAMDSVTLPDKANHLISRLLPLILIGSIGWMLMRVVTMISDALLARFRTAAEEDMKAREVYTQLAVIRRVAGVLIIVLTGAAMLMTFEQVRQVGVSILASAGIAGLVVGLAAQRTLGTLLAGIHIAIARPIRLNDSVVVEGEWGWIEKITLTYVVVRIWDLRRLVVPTTYFLEKPFQNWTLNKTNMIGTVMIYADYSVPVQAMRDELKRILDERPEWDQKVWGLQVTDANNKVIEVRAIMGASDISAVWDLRCAVREEMLKFLQKHYPESLPRVRIDMEKGR